MSSTVFRFFGQMVHFIHRIFNVVTIAGPCMIIIFLSGAFYMGTIDSFQELKQNLFQSILSRFFVASLLGLPSLVILVVGNMLFNSIVTSKHRIHIRKVLWISLIATSIAAGLGTISFFL